MYKFLLMAGVFLVGCGEKHLPVESCQKRAESAKLHCINNGTEVNFGPKAKEHNAGICALVKTTTEDNQTGDKAVDEATSNRCDFEAMTILSRYQKMMAKPEE